MRGALVAALSLVAAAASGQDLLRVTARELSKDTTIAMFGRLPRTVFAVRVDVCNQTAGALTVPLARINQQATLAAGITVLPHDVAFVVIAAAQGNSRAAKIIRYGFFTASMVAIGANWSAASPSLKQTLTGVALAGGQAVGLLGATLSSHAYLEFDHESLPDPLQLAPLGCATGIALIEDSSPKAKNATRRMDFSIEGEHEKDVLHAAAR